MHKRKLIKVKTELHMWKHKLQKLNQSKLIEMKILSAILYMLKHKLLIFFSCSSCSNQRKNI